ncbi:MAG: hydantoinase/oxoprolinase family protein [Pseudomonadota bacterium]
MIIGLDVGGTHTDAVLLSRDGIVRDVKVPTDTLDLFSTVLKTLTALLDGIDSTRIKRIVLSTTLTTNAVVQKKVAPVGIIVSSGPGIDPEEYRTGEHYHTVSGSIDHRGRERSPVNPREIVDIAIGFRESGIRTVGVIGKFSPRNPSHELIIRDLVQPYCDTIFMGHQVSSNLNFPRRITTVNLDAAVYTMHRDFFNAVRSSLKQKGLNAPIQILKADGGTMSLEASMISPGQTILSGPAASVMGAIPYAPDNMDALVLDIGGTTTDIAVLVNRSPLLEPVGIKRGIYKSLIRSLQTVSKGIGGDSNIRVENGHLAIGPERKGPALAFGGPLPTPTDALIALGLMDMGNKTRAQEGIQDLANQLGMSVVDAARLIVTRTCTIILDHARDLIRTINEKPVYTVHEFLEGYTTNPRKIMLLGGPAPYLAGELQIQSGIETVTIPAFGVANAIGAALARTTCEVSLFADTEQGFAISPEEDFSEPVSRNYSEDDAVESTYNLLYEKAVKSGSDPENLEVEVIEFQKFNIVRGFSAKGKIFRIKMQVKPGLIQGYDAVWQKASLWDIQGGSHAPSR